MPGAGLAKDQSIRATTERLAVGSDLAKSAKEVKGVARGPTLGSSNQSIKFLQGRNGRPNKDLTRMPCVNPTVTACD
jgi:hypothetical protein